MGLFFLMKARLWLDLALPDDPQAVAKLVGRQARDVKKVWPEVRPLFDLVDGTLVLLELEKQRAEHAEWREKSRKGGLASAAARCKAGSTVVEPNANQSVEPAGNTAICDLHTAHSDLLSEKKETQRSVSSLRPDQDNEHRAHAWCGRKCVPTFLHREFMQQLHFVDDAEQRLLTWYPQVLEIMPPVILEAPAKFWRSAFENYAPIKPSEYHHMRMPA